MKYLDNKFVKFIFFFAGLCLFIKIVGDVSWKAFGEVFVSNKKELILVLLMPMIWYFFNIQALYVLMLGRFKISLRLMSIHIVSEALNSALPLVGAAGEPYKIFRISSLENMKKKQVFKAVFAERILNSCSGFFSCFILSALYLTFGDENKYFFSVKIILILSLVITCVMFFFMTRDFPRLSFKGISSRKLSLAFVLKLLGRFFSVLELLVLIFALKLGIGDDVFYLASLALMVSGLMFFFVPQGIGVEEFSIISVFSYYGLPQESAILLGLLRRIRITLWTIFGLAIFSLNSIVRTIGVNSPSKSK